MKPKTKRDTSGLSQLSSLFSASLPIGVSDATVIALVMYLLPTAIIYATFSQWIGIALIANAVIALVVGLTARSMGKQESAVVVLGLLLGPIGALAGLIAAPLRKD